MVKPDRVIAVFGCGFVGGTVADYLEDAGIAVTRVDPKLYPDTDTQKAIKNSDGIIVCVPTPMDYNGACDDSIVKDVLSQTTGKVLLKSTVTPDLVDTYGSNVIYNPEFLREATAKEDFANSTFHIFGHKDNEQDAKWWSEMFGKFEILTDRRTASMVKYVHNSWLATKVAWFHELYANLPEDINYNTLTTILGLFPTIGSNHMAVPNAEGTLGYGGHCFPKDISALTKVLDHSIIKHIKTVNEQLNEIKIQ